MILIISFWSAEKLLNIGDKVNFLSPSFIHSVDTDNNGNVYIAFLSSYTNPYLEVYFAKINKNGNLEYFKNVSKAGSVYSLWAGYSNLIFTDSCIYAIWDDRRISYHDMNFQNEIFFRKYYQNISGGVWSGVENVTENDGNWSINPSVLLKNNIVHIVWQDTRNGLSEIFYKYFNNGIWSNNFIVSNSKIYAGSPSVAIYGNTIFLFFEEVNNGKTIIKCKNIKDGSSLIISDTMRNSFNPVSDFSQGKMGVIWNQIMDGEIYTFYREYDGLWKEIETIHNSSNLTEFDLDLNNYRSIVWSENGDIFYKDDNLIEPIKINESSYFCSNPIIKKDANGNIFIFWNGYLSGKPDKKIFYKIYDNSKYKDSFLASYLIEKKLEIPVDAKRYFILSIDGRKIKEEKIKNNWLNLDFVNYPQGIYILILDKGKDIEKRKIIHITR